MIAQPAFAFHCPADKKEFQKSGSSYLWNSTQNGRHVSQLVFFGVKGRPDRIPLIYEKETWHPSGMNFLFADMSSSNKLRFAAAPTYHDNIFLLHNDSTKVLRIKLRYL